MTINSTHMQNIHACVRIYIYIHMLTLIVSFFASINNITD